MSVRKETLRERQDRQADRGTKRGSKHEGYRILGEEGRKREGESEGVIEEAMGREGREQW